MLIFTGFEPTKVRFERKKSKKCPGETRVWSRDLWIAKLILYHWAIESIQHWEWKRFIMAFYHHYQCSFKLSFCHLEILKKILIFSKISHWISIFSIITIYSYHKRIPDGLKIVPYLFWVISSILDSVHTLRLKKTYSCTVQTYLPTFCSHVGGNSVMDEARFFISKLWVASL